MKIMCLNGWGGKLHHELSKYVAAASPDILCLQEVVHSPEAEDDWLTYRDGGHVLPQRANFFRDMCSALPDHAAYFCPAAQGVLWRDETPVPSQWGVATFVREAIPIIAQTHGFVHKAFSPNGYGDHPRSRTAHAVRLYDFEKDRAVCVTHMHGLRDLRGKMDTPERSAQVRRLLKLSDCIAESGDAVIICGDFNVEPQSETLNYLSENGFEELVLAGKYQSTRTSLYEKPNKFADYMLVNKQVNVIDFQVVLHPVVSDHCPLVLEI